MRTILAIVVVAALGLLAWLIYQNRHVPPLVVSGFIEADEIRVGPRIGGRVAEVNVAEGAVVSAGDLLFRIEPFDLKSKQLQAQAELAGAQAEYARLQAGFRPEELQQPQPRRDRLAATLAKLVAGPRPREIEIARQKLQVAAANEQLAQAEQRRIAQTAASGVSTPSDLDHANREFKAAEAQRLAAENELKLLEEGTRAEEISEARAALAEADAAFKLTETGYRKQDIEQAAARVAAAEAQVSAIQAQLDELTIKAPTTSVVEAVDLRPGDLIAPNGPAIALLDTSRLWVRTYIPEARLGRLKLSQHVPIRVDGFPDRTFQGTITYLASSAEFTPRNVQTPEQRSKQVFRAKISLDPSPELRVGVMVDVLLDEVN
jgi:HlyD family secretion protein